MFKYLLITLTFCLSFNYIENNSALSLPPPEDIPEEVLRQEIVIEARSPIDGQPITAAEYIELQNQVAESKYPPELASEIKNQVFLLELLHFLRTITPF